MKILTAEQIRNVDAYTIEHEPIPSIDLMERASRACFNWLTETFGMNKSYQIVVGPGNNGGDGLAIARMLVLSGNRVSVYLLANPESFSPDAMENYKRLSTSDNISIQQLTNSNLPQIQASEIIIDALFGSGLSRPLEGLTQATVNHINQSESTVVSIDIPSGLSCDVNNYKGSIVKADYTISFQTPKLAFLFAENEPYIGQWHILDIGLHKQGIDNQVTELSYQTTIEIQTLVKARPRFSHKGTYGHALLIAGSYGMMGAAVLSARACLRSGIGLLSARIVPAGYSILQTAVPECIASTDLDLPHLSTLPELSRYSAVGIGPGIGSHAQTAALVYQLITSSQQALVIDADALNILSANPDWLTLLPENTILTPHPGEFDRIAGKSTSGYERFRKQQALSQKLHIIIVLKGACTSISLPDGQCYFNSTGNSGMATAGSGDVLTGIILSLLAQNYLPANAARLAVFLHGLAGDLALNTNSEQSLIASDIIEHLGPAFKHIMHQKL